MDVKAIYDLQIKCVDLSNNESPCFVMQYNNLSTLYFRDPYAQRIDDSEADILHSSFSYGKRLLTYNALLMFLVKTF